MRWWVWVSTLLLLFTPIKCDAGSEDHNGTVTVRVSASLLGSSSSVLALRSLTSSVLRASRVSVTEVASPDACNVPDDRACLDSILKELSTDIATVALATIPAGETPAAWELREAGIEELGEITAASRRACLVTKPPARSLLDLAEPNIARIYNVPDSDLRSLSSQCNSTCNITLTPEWCKDEICATLLTNGQGEAKVLWSQVRTHKLYATVQSLGDWLPKVAISLAERPIIACDWAPELTPLANLHADILGPPPCLFNQPCPFETRRIVKFINIRKLARFPSAVRALVQLNVPTEEMKRLVQVAAVNGPEEAAQNFLKEQPSNTRIGEIRVAVLIPKETKRETYDAQALAAAAALAEVDLESDYDTKLPVSARFKVEMTDDGCHTVGAYKYWNDALGTSDFSSLSALVGPACGAAWVDLARHSLPHRVPMLAYTPQAPSTSPASQAAEQLQLLAAGDTREASSALAAFISDIGWHRLAVLSEPGTRPLLDAIRPYAKFDVHVEVSDVGRNFSADTNLIQQWARKAASENTRVLYLCVEDARLARTALCAAKSVGLTPEAGAVWLLCGVLKTEWLQPGTGENCTKLELEKLAEGHFTVLPDWALAWQRNAQNASSFRQSWENRWKTRCRSLAHVFSDKSTVCEMAPGPTAALLYDTILQWAGSLFKLLQHNPSAADDLHNEIHVRALINYTISTNYTGLTGPFQWKAIDGSHAREVSLALSQRRSDNKMYKVGTWSNGALELNMAALKWYTTDGRTPDDGSEICALQGLADVLHADCRTAFIALTALLVAILIVALAAIALHCRRRAEKEYRKRLQALGMRPLAIKPAGLDRWEIPRERVVINRKLGTGAFGTVYGGHALLAEGRGWSAVAVKTLKAGASTEEKLDFLSEAEAMKRFDHKNVVRLLGVVTKTEPVCTVMEFMLYGDLKNYLLARRHLAMGGGEEESEADEASPRRLTGMALDVARALSYLAQLRYVHRDVAARNCLVSARRVVKLADFGMTRLVFENDYYRFSRKGMLPVRWMAPESLALGVFSPASDVWSFGVLLYEIVTFGSLPFQGLSNSEVLGKVKAGHTLDLPSGLKPTLEGLIKSCWQQDPKKRPTASEVAAFLADAPRLLAPCLDVPLDSLPLDGDPPWRLPRDQAEARWVSWAAPASAATDTTYLSTDGPVPLDTDSFLP